MSVKPAGPVDHSHSLKRIPGCGFSIYSASRKQLIDEIKRLLKEQENLKRQLAESEKENAESQKQLTESQEQLAESQKKIAESEKRIADLEHQLALRGKDSSNSSKPPSSDSLNTSKRTYPQRPRSGRKPGGQPGHPGHHRPLIPTEQVDKVITVLPGSCEKCGRALPQDLEKLITTGTTYRHQITELPPVKPQVTEEQRPTVLCPDCQHPNQVPLAEPFDSFGPRLTALIACLTVHYRVPRRGVVALLESLLGISISLGSIQKLLQQTSQALASPCQELEQQLTQEPVLNGDETGWRFNGTKQWLWVLVAQCFAFFHIAASRS